MDNQKPPFWAGSWYFPVTIVSVGLLAWVPFTHAAGRLRRRSIAVLAVLYAALAVIAMVLMIAAPTDAQGLPTGGGTAMIIVGELLLLALVIGGCVHQVWLRRQVYHVTTEPEAEPELAAALRARARRAVARKLIADDPLIARELRIGRPDLPGDYDDGGLVDLNSAPAAMIAMACQLTPRTADGIVAARVECGGFLTVEDLFSMADIPMGAWDMIRDRSVAMTPAA